MSADYYPYEEVKAPFNRTLVIDAGYLASKRHIIYGILEADVTLAKQRIDDDAASANSNNEKLSFTAYIVACIGRAVAANPSVQAYRRRGTNRLVIFRDVDVVVMVEGPEVGATAIPHIVRRANAKSVREISDEIRTVQTNPKKSDQKYDGLRLFTKLPRWMRMMIYRRMRRNPEKLRQTQGTVIVTSIGMMARKGRGFWGITFLPMHTLGVTLGGIARKPTAVRVPREGGAEEEQIVIRDILSMTLAFDHDCVDGAPATRFGAELVELIEGATLLLETAVSTSTRVESSP